MNDITSYLDKDGYKVEIGAIVMYEENFHTPDNEYKTYTILKMPNYGNTVIMVECSLTDNAEVKDIVDKTEIEVEPWKIGAI